VSSPIGAAARQRLQDGFGERGSSRFGDAVSTVRLFIPVFQQLLKVSIRMSTTRIEGERETNSCNRWGRVVSRIFASWNQLDRWLQQVEGLRRVA